MRDYRLTDTVRVVFSTSDSTGAAVTMTSATVSVYDENSTTQTTTGVTTTTDFDGVTGLHLVSIALATLGALPGHTYTVILQATVATKSVVQVIGQFSVLAQGGDIVSRGQLSAGGAGTFTLPAGQLVGPKVGDAIRIVSGTGKGYRPILTYNSGTGVGTVSAWDTNPVANDYYEVVALPNPEVLAATDFADGFLTSAKILDNAITAAKIADGAIDAATFAAGAINAAAIASAAITAAKFATDAVDANALKADAVAEIQSGLATSATQATILAAVDTEVASILADTTNIKTRLPAALVSGRMDSSLPTGGIVAATFATDALSAAAVSAAAVTKVQSGLATSAAQTSMQTDVTAIKGFVDTEVASILAVTNKIDGALELNGGLYRFTVAALANAPSGGSGLTANAVRDAVFAQLIESGLSFSDMCKLTAAVLFGLTNDIEGPASSFTSADISGGAVVGTKTRITGSRQADGDRASLTVDLT